MPNSTPRPWLTSKDGGRRSPKATHVHDQQLQQDGAVLAARAEAPSMLYWTSIIRRRAESTGTGRGVAGSVDDSRGGSGGGGSSINEDSKHGEDQSYRQQSTSGEGRRMKSFRAGPGSVTINAAELVAHDKLEYHRSINSKHRKSASLDSSIVNLPPGPKSFPHNNSAGPAMADAASVLAASDTCKWRDAIPSAFCSPSMFGSGGGRQRPSTLRGGAPIDQARRQAERAARVLQDINNVRRRHRRSPQLLQDPAADPRKQEAKLLSTALRELESRRKRRVPHRRRGESVISPLYDDDGHPLFDLETMNSRHPFYSFSRSSASGSSAASERTCPSLSLCSSYSSSSEASTTESMAARENKEAEAEAGAQAEAQAQAQPTDKVQAVADVLGELLAKAKRKEQTHAREQVKWKKQARALAQAIKKEQAQTHAQGRTEAEEQAVAQPPAQAQAVAGMLKEMLAKAKERNERHRAAGVAATAAVASSSSMGSPEPSPVATCPGCDPSLSTPQAETVSSDNVARRRAPTAAPAEPRRGWSGSPFTRIAESATNSASCRLGVPPPRRQTATEIDGGEVPESVLVGDQGRAGGDAEVRLPGRGTGLATTAMALAAALAAAVAARSDVAGEDPERSGKAGAATSAARLGAQTKISLTRSNDGGRQKLDGESQEGEAPLPRSSVRQPNRGTKDSAPSGAGTGLAKTSEEASAPLAVTASASRALGTANTSQGANIPEVVANEDVPAGRAPPVWVVHHVDQSERHGVAFLLSDGTVVICFRDDTMMAAESTTVGEGGGAVEYYGKGRSSAPPQPPFGAGDGRDPPAARRQERERRCTRFTMQSIPLRLKKKVKLFTVYRRHLLTLAAEGGTTKRKGDTDEPVSGQEKEVGRGSGGCGKEGEGNAGVAAAVAVSPKLPTLVWTPSVLIKAYRATRDSTLFVLSDGTKQIAFSDHTEVLLSGGGDNLVTFVHADGQQRRETLTLARAFHENRTDIIERVDYCNSLINILQAAERLVSHSEAGEAREADGTIEEGAQY